jgi:hypothetical protein
MDLTRKRERERLAERNEPYWHRLGKGKALGFRRGSDTWVVRLTARDRKRTKTYRALEDLNLDFDTAKEKAEAWIELTTYSAVRKVKRGSVRAALDAYLADLKKHDRPGAAKGAEDKFKVCLYEDELADLQLDRATRDDFEDWRERQRAGRLNRTVNRQVRSVMAGLNRAVELGHVGNPLAWRLKKLSDDVEDANETAVCLTADERRVLLGAADPSTADLLKGIDHTGCRPIELANAIVSDFDGTLLRLAHRKGRPPRLRVRHVMLGPDGVDFFARMVGRKAAHRADVCTSSTPN